MFQIIPSKTPKSHLLKFNSLLLTLLVLLNNVISFNLINFTNLLVLLINFLLVRGVTPLKRKIVLFGLGKFANSSGSAITTVDSSTDIDTPTDAVN